MHLRSSLRGGGLVDIDLIMTAFCVHHQLMAGVLDTGEKETTMAYIIRLYRVPWSKKFESLKASAVDDLPAEDIPADDLPAATYQQTTYQQTTYQSRTYHQRTYQPRTYQHKGINARMKISSNRETVAVANLELRSVLKILI